MSQQNRIHTCKQTQRKGDKRKWTTNEIQWQISYIQNKKMVSFFLKLDFSIQVTKNKVPYFLLLPGLRSSFPTQK